MHKLAGLIGMAKKAGRLIAGTEQVNEAVRSGKAVLVLIACDVAENSRKRLENCSSYYETAYITVPFDRERLGAAIGASATAAVALTDSGFAKAVRERLG